MTLKQCLRKHPRGGSLNPQRSQLTGLQRMQPSGNTGGAAADELSYCSGVSPEMPIVQTQFLLDDALLLDMVTGIFSDSQVQTAAVCCVFCFLFSLSSSYVLEFPKLPRHKASLLDHSLKCKTSVS